MVADRRSQKCLAAYLYLINPPPGAKHHPVHPRNIVIAGDSAGGGLVLALLQILRDTLGLELPAGAVLISPVSAPVEVLQPNAR
jgi:acetyl esterase/lipase